MEIVVVIPTVGRRSMVTRVLGHLEEQERVPSEVIVSAPDQTHVEPYCARRFKLSYLFGRRGLCAQRNLALEQVLEQSDIITFFDDDFLPAKSYLRVLSEAFEHNPDWSVVCGHVVRDGAHGPGFSFEEGLAALRHAEASHIAMTEVADHVGAYGCNMSVRSKQVGALRFDERLVLYGWQEDIDFTSQLRRYGRVVGLNSLIGVHLGAKSGRISGVRFGYSQMMNPTYLLMKGTMPASFALPLMVRNLCANALKSFWPESYIDRRGRLKGNVLAAYHILTGRIEPEHILNL